MATFHTYLTVGPIHLLKSSTGRRKLHYKNLQSFPTFRNEFLQQIATSQDVPLLLKYALNDPPLQTPI